MRSSVHLAGSRPTLRFPIRGLHSCIFLPHRPSTLRATWPFHCYFSLLIRCVMSTTFVLLWISSFLIRSRKETIHSYTDLILEWPTGRCSGSVFLSMWVQIRKHPRYRNCSPFLISNEITITYSQCFSYTFDIYFYIRWHTPENKTVSVKTWSLQSLVAYVKIPNLHT